MCPIICQFSKHSLFQKKGAIISKFLCFKYSSGKIFFGLLKHFKIGGSTNVCLFLVEKKEKNKKEKNRQTDDNWNFWFWFLSKNGRFLTQICFSKDALLKPLFYSVFWLRPFLAKWSKREISDTHQKKKWMIDSWKAFLGGYFCVCVFLFSFCLEGLRVRWGGPKGHLTWP